jgi:hypothetical protein
MQDPWLVQSQCLNVLELGRQMGSKDRLIIRWEFNYGDWTEV